MSYLGETNSKDTDYSTANISIFNLISYSFYSTTRLKIFKWKLTNIWVKIGEGFGRWNKWIDNGGGIKLEEAILNPQIPT